MSEARFTREGVLLVERSAPLFFLAGMIASMFGLMAFFILKTALSFAVIRAFESDGTGSPPLPAGRCVGLGALRTVLELCVLAFLGFIAGEAIGSGEPLPLAMVWVVLCCLRVPTWWAVGCYGAEFRGRTLWMLVAFGIGVDVLFDATVLAVYHAAFR